ncbi:MAG: DUF3716 domain-containing protein [Polyangiaceae bacterium]|nr:DUF3716 domain-containing protein [Polyangiaceae bacterium]
MRKAIVAMVVLSATPGCGAGLVFKDQPAVWRLDDTRSIAEPKEREYLAIQYFADAFGMRTLERALELRDREPAWNANALEEVPDSTWFTNRIGLRAMTAEEVARGPALKGPPRPPYTIKSGKSGGGALGFIIEDADGRKFLVKFDRAENPEMQTGTNVVVNRLFWAFGYNVPSDYVFELARDELSISKKATAKDRFGNKIPYTAEMLDAALSAGPPLRRAAIARRPASTCPECRRGASPWRACARTTPTTSSLTSTGGSCAACASSPRGSITPT